jgi:hypothetical protein
VLPSNLCNLSSIIVLLDLSISDYDLALKTMNRVYHRDIHGASIWICTDI